MDGRIYARPGQGGLLSGGFEKNPKPIFTEGRNQLEIQNMQEDWDHFGKITVITVLWRGLLVDQMFRGDICKTDSNFRVPE